MMSSHLESPERAVDPVGAIQHTTQDRIGTVLDTTIGVAGATASLAGYGMARISREVWEGLRKMMQGFRRESYDENA